MEKKHVLAALKEMRGNSKPRKFTQTVELGINFRNVDFKKIENQIDVELTLPNPIGKGEGKVLLFARDKEFAFQAKDIADTIIMEDEIPKINKKRIGELMNQYIGFLAEGPVMLTVGKHLGQTLAPKNKMPLPVTQDIHSFESIVGRLKSVVKVSNKKGKHMPVVHTPVGKENMEDEKIAENALAVYQAVLPAVQNKPANIKSAYIKLTMSSPVTIDSKDAKNPGVKK